MFSEEKCQRRVEKAGFQNIQIMNGQSTASGYTRVLASNKERLAVHLLVNQPLRTDKGPTVRR